MRFVNLAVSDEPCDGFVLDPREGDIYTDGSLHNASEPLFTRAGWSVVQTSQLGESTRAIYGTVPAAFELSSTVAEFFGILNGVHYSVAPPCVFTDSLAAVNLSQRDRAHLCGPRQNFAGFWRGMFSMHQEDLITCTNFVWPEQSLPHVKAHRDESSADNQTDQRHILGNQIADTYANKRTLLHSPPEGEINYVNKYKRHVIWMLIGFVKVLQQWPGPRELFGAKTRARQGASERTGGIQRPNLRPHEFVWDSQKWVFVASDCVLNTKPGAFWMPNRVAWCLNF